MNSFWNTVHHLFSVNAFFSLFWQGEEEVVAHLVLSFVILVLLAFVNVKAMLNAQFDSQIV